MGPLLADGEIEVCLVADPDGEAVGLGWSGGGGLVERGLGEGFGRSEERRVGKECRL